MRRDEQLPRVGPETRLDQALLEISRKGLGMTAIVDEQNRVIGVYTDGDLRRSLDQRIDIHETEVGQVMTHPCRTARPDMLAVEALKLMEDHRINALPVVDEEGRMIGALNMHDLLRAGVV